MLVFAPAVMTAMMADALRRHAERRVRFATDRFDKRIREVDLRLVDANGPRGGVDKICRITVTLRHGPILFTEARKANFYAAINDASRRLRNVLSRRTAPKRSRQGGDDLVD